jgi:hypothetical protein
MIERSAEFVSLVSNFSEEEFRYSLRHASVLSDRNVGTRSSLLDLILVRFLSRGQLCLETRSLSARVLLAGRSTDSLTIAEQAMLYYVCECELNDRPELQLSYDQAGDLFEMSRIAALPCGPVIRISTGAINQLRINFAASMRSAEYRPAAMAAVCLSTVDREYLPIYKSAEQHLSFIEKEMRQTALGLELYLLRRQLCNQLDG